MRLWLFVLFCVLAQLLSTSAEVTRVTITSRTITTVAKSTLQKRVGKLAEEDMIRVNRAVLVFLGLAGRS